MHGQRNIYEFHSHVNVWLGKTTRDSHVWTASTSLQNPQPDLSMFTFSLEFRRSPCGWLPGLSRYRTHGVGYARYCHETVFFFRWSLCFSVNKRGTQRAQTVLFRTASYFSLCYHPMIVTRRFSLMSSTIYSLFLSVQAFRGPPLRGRSAVPVFLPLKCSLRRVCPSRVVDNELPATRQYFAHWDLWHEGRRLVTLSLPKPIYDHKDIFKNSGIFIYEDIYYKTKSILQKCTKNSEIPSWCSALSSL